MNADEMDRDELVVALLYTAGDSATTAAVELLIAHGHWLRRDLFLAAVRVWTDPGGDVGARADWSAVSAVLDGGLPDTNSERGILAIAASLAGGHRVDLGGAMSSLDRTNLGLVATAVRRAGGLS